ncbi:MAG: glutaredoxin family protein [Schwartzia sp. (in: firmicutes)]
MVKVYSITNCPWCDKVKKYLKSRGVEFEERNVEHNKEYFDAAVALSGADIVPVTTVNDKDFVVSFDKEKLDALLGLK